MKKKRVYIFLGAIIALTILSGSLVDPNPYNSVIDFLNSKAGFGFSHFWSVPFKFGLDLKGGTHLIYEADLSSVSQGDRSAAMQGLRDIIERRINLFGVAEPVVQTEGASGDSARLIVELAGVKDPAEAIKMIGQTPFLEFKEAVYDEKDPTKIIGFKSTELTGRYLKRADMAFDQNTQEPSISIQFNDEGAKLFEDITGRNIGKPLAIFIDSSLISAPKVNDKISGGKAQISGKFTVSEAKELARNLNAGALPVPIKLLSQESVGPTLGAVSLNKSLFAGLLGLAAVIFFMVAFYRLSGLFASLALFVYICLVLSIFKLIPVTITLAGIGGFLLSIGIAVDANVLIFARLKEELDEGKSFGPALEEGFRRSWPPIRDGHATTILVALILFFFGTSFFKGFALTLIIGLLASLFSAIIVTRTFMRIFVATKLEKLRWLWI